jgi:hypothetical protein
MSFGGISDDKAHSHVVALDRTFLDQAANAEGLALRRLAGGDFGGCYIQGDVAVEGIERERGGQRQRGQPARNQGNAFLSWFHELPDW